MNKTLAAKYISLAFLVVVTAICAFFIIYNAQWVIGDDAMVMNGIGFGGYFSPKGTVWPESGRFFPFNYLSYNILAFLYQGNVTATAVYVYHLFYFLLMVVAATWLFLKIQKDNVDSPLIYITSFFALLFVVSKTYLSFANCFSTGWFSMGITFLQLLLLYYFVTRKHIWCAVVYMIITVYFTYCTESVFLSPLALGICGLYILRDQNTKREKLFYWGLIVNAIVFLLIYFFFIYLKIETKYDGGHGSEVGLLQNVVNITIAQKIFWIAIPLMFYRLWRILIKKEQGTIFDVILLVAAAETMGGFILKLNWVLYYDHASMLCMVSIVYFCNKYFNPKWTLLVVAILGLWYARKLPANIVKINDDRTDAISFVSTVIDESENNNVFCYSPDTDIESFDSTFRSFLESSFGTYYAYMFHDKNIKPIHKTVFDGSEGVWITFDETNRLLEDGNSVIIDSCTLISSNKMRKMNAYKYVAK